MAIVGFFGNHRHLSNFGHGEVMFRGHKFKYRENAFQWGKVKEELAETLLPQYTNCEAYESKQLSREHQAKGMLSDKTKVAQARIELMEEVLRSFYSTPGNVTSLLMTGDHELIEANWWHDIFWGVCYGHIRIAGRVCSKPRHDPMGENNLGKLLMKLRKELLNATVEWKTEPQ
jgi:predicted NAD-dependent protein-ADP-ribosyltransferase YbiA (DUF1768 family)